MNYNNRVFRAISNSDNGEVSSDTEFHYAQEGRVLAGTYFGGSIKKGQLIGWVDDGGRIDMRYQHINNDGKIMSGKCKSVPEILPSGKIRLYEKWRWTSGDKSTGESIIEEV
ncbi:hypothetical protein GCM10007049_04140 [Echinicola pacifica]|uniref:N-acetylglutamate synthase n=1 Tax=Echinicola pacifica TaxID=346377 RepID=A0A918PMZ4_9BACT|nr:hypothetical protein [Echinicola pacifica]GGZ15246.1 hypothetical protein GCM10007049_04140 [Echinicola pacifica]